MSTLLLPLIIEAFEHVFVGECRVLHGLRDIRHVAQIGSFRKNDKRRIASALRRNRREFDRRQLTS